MQKRTKGLLMSVPMLLAGFGSTGLTLAYFTDGETAENKFTIGDVSIEGLEPNYPGNDCDEVKDIVPNKEIAKDPIIDNKGVNDAIVFMTVDSPMEYITVVKDNGKDETSKSVNELFWFKDIADDMTVHANNFDAGWQRLPAKEMYVKIAADGTETVVNGSTQAMLKAAYDGLGRTDTLVKRYVFGYKQAIQGSTTHDGSAQTAANKKTTPLFDKIQLKNVIENEIDEAVESVVVRSYAIQASEILENSVDLGANLTEANLGKIYDIYIRQNSAADDESGLKVEGLRPVDQTTPSNNGASGTQDQHNNRFDTQDDVQSVNCNINPEKCNSSTTGQGQLDGSVLGDWYFLYTADGDNEIVHFKFNPDGTFYSEIMLYSTGALLGEPVNGTYTDSEIILPNNTLSYSYNPETDLLIIREDQYSREMPSPPVFDASFLVGMWYDCKSAEEVVYTYGEDGSVKAYINDSLVKEGTYSVAYNTITTLEVYGAYAINGDILSFNSEEYQYNPASDQYEIWYGNDCGFVRFRDGKAEIGVVHNEKVYVRWNGDYDGNIFYNNLNGLIESSNDGNSIRIEDMHLERDSDDCFAVS